MAEVTIIGKLLQGGEQRDAIHIAVAPVKADMRLYPGQHLRFAQAGDTELVAFCAEGDDLAVGIVDPFLALPVQKGERFWMFLYQHSITSLRHNWTHPAFSEAPAVKAPPAVDKAASEAASEAWLRNFLENSRSIYANYHEVIAAAIRADEEDDNSVHINGSDASGEIPPEFWDHVEVVTGKSMVVRPEYFSCSC